MIDLLVLFFWYLLAFVVGLLLMAFALPRLAPARTPDEALDAAYDRAFPEDAAPAAESVREPRR